MTWLYVAAGLGVVFVLVLLFIGWMLAWDAWDRLRRRWYIYRSIAAADRRMFRESLRLSVEHWRQTKALLDAADRQRQARGR
ncbi:hypothetical protein H4696_008022 [Amycolatopsis lexingtonensis]|uniref:Uncharacterized protein n=1 Tax=Amycolatopsis lexingtonensis TaxID=218822 RepID=A0ABR9ICN1_9PSEU|nr:hypothetical protein [Amycolatopsis lexingtonensis]MBE1500922.1 hypothetical protein [Amycolatopsis lexingtonensis]